MQQLVEFLANHAVLTAAFIAVLGGLLWTTVGGARGVPKLSPMEATRLINHEDAVLLDVRGEGEFNEGHIVNSVHIPLSSLSEQLSKVEKYKERAVIPACRTGQQSAKACAMLRKHGFQKVYNLNGGILAWQNASLPLTKK